MFAIRYLVNQVVLGVVLNLLALGLTGFLYDALMAPNSNSYNNVGTLSVLKIPLLGNIPIIGPLLFDETIIVYLTYVLIFAVDILLFRTRWGLRTRAVGEHPKAADTVGINVRRTRYINVLIGGMLAGLAGASLTIGNSSGVREEHDRRPRLHRARRGHLRPVEPAWRGRRCPAVRFR